MTGVSASGLPKVSTYTAEERLQLLDAASRPDPIGVRDVAIMTLMWAGSLRRSEVGPLTIEDVHVDERGRGITLMISKSKTDVNGMIARIRPELGPDGKPLPIDAWHALQEWLTVYENLIGRPLTLEDPLFINVMHARSRGAASLTAKAVGEVIERYAGAAGITAELGERISSHGFRAGYATEALAAGTPDAVVAHDQRRTDTGSVLGYYRPADPFESRLKATIEDANRLQDIHDITQLNAKAKRDERNT